jgi:hypothetical protein
MLYVTAAKYLSDYRVWLAFNDGTQGEVDLADRLHGKIFAPLKDKVLFGQVVLDPEADTIVWPNGADLAPEYFKSLLPVQISATF